MEELIYCPICGENICKSKRIANIGIQVYSSKKCGLDYVDPKAIIKLCDGVDSVRGDRYVSGLNGIENLRIKNFKKILFTMKNILGIQTESKGLEVGSATGLFIVEAKKEGFEVEGIEPMYESCRISWEKGLNVKNGYFPADIDQTQRFDFIIFNDVFEHIPDIEKCVSSCFNHLNPGGILIINLPDKDGILYKLSKAMCKFGDSTAFGRLWQLGTASPHLYYFNGKSLDYLLGKYGFTRIRSVKLKSVSLEGLWGRIQAVPISKMKAICYFACLAIVYPLINLFHSDTNCFMYIRE